MEQILENLLTNKTKNRETITHKRLSTILQVKEYW